MIETILSQYFDIEQYINDLDVWKSQLFKQINTGQLGLCDKCTPDKEIKKVNSIIKQFRNLIDMERIFQCSVKINEIQCNLTIHKNDHKYAKPMSNMTPIMQNTSKHDHPICQT